MNAPTRSRALLFVLLAATAFVATATVAASPVSNAEVRPAVDFDVSPQQTPKTSTNATITFENQTRRGQSVYIESVTLPDGGFVVLEKPNGTVVGVSLPLSPGTHNGRITLRGVPGTTLNQSRLGANTTLIATLYRDADSDGRFDALLASGTDEPYIENGTPVRDRAYIVIPPEERPTNASVVLTNQTTNGTTITVASVTLPDGGYVGILQGTYNESNATERVIGATEYLEPGTYQNVTIAIGATVQNGSAIATGPVSAVVYTDSDGDRQFQYVPSGGVEDQPYTENGTTVAASAFVTVERPQTPTQTPVSTAVGTRAPTAASTAEPSTAEPPQTVGDHDKLTPYGDTNNKREGILTNPLFPLLVVVFAVFAVLAAVGGR